MINKEGDFALFALIAKIRHVIIRKFQKYAVEKTAYTTQKIT